MRLQHYVLAALVASVSSAALAQMPASRDTRMRPRPKSPSRTARVLPRPEAAMPSAGTISGYVLGAEGDPQQWTVIIEGGSAKREVFADEHGHFEARVAPGIYKAYVKVPEGERAADAEYPTFYVSPGGTAKVQVDPAYEYFFCTKSGEKVIPAISSDREDEIRPGLSRPRYASYNEKKTPHGTTKDVIQYCSRVPTGKGVQYMSPTFVHPNFILASEQATHINLGDTWSVKGGTLYRHGVAESRETANLKFTEDGQFINFTGKPFFYAKGDGAINSGAATFEIKVDDRGVKKLEYTDLNSGLKLSSNGKEGCILITESATAGLTIDGRAIVTKPGATRSEVREFKVILQDRGGESKREDEFSISIFSNNNMTNHKDYEKSGLVTSGDISLSGNLKKSGRQSSKASTPLSSSRLNVPARMRRP